MESKYVPTVILLAVVLAGAMLYCTAGKNAMSEEEFSALVGKPVCEAERLLGTPDIVKNGWLIWEDRVYGPSGHTKARAALRIENGKVVNHGVVYRD